MNATKVTQAQRESSLRERVRSLLRWLAWTSSSLILLAWFTIDRYEVRGNSMQPLLLDRTPQPDRVVAWKPYYRFFEPQRFDLVIFERPRLEVPGIDAANMSNDRCIKRIFGLSGERPWIDGGDVFIDGDEGRDVARRRVQRPPRVIESMLVEVAHFSAAQVGTDPWLMPQKAHWDSGSRILSGSEAEPGAILFDALVKNDWVDDAGRAVGGGEIVNDVGLEIGFSFAAGGERLAIELREQADLFRFIVLRTGALRVERRRGPSAASDHLGVWNGDAFPTDRPLRLRVLNVDDRLLVWIDGSVVLDLSYDGNEEVLGPWTNGPRVVVDGGAIEIESMRVIRDAYFTSIGVATGLPYAATTIPTDHYFFLGDNSSNSIDSRDFGPVPRSAFEGRPWLRLRSGLGISEL